MPVRLHETEAMLSERADVDEAVAVDYGADGPVMVLVKPLPFCSGPELRDLCALSLGDDGSRVTVILVPEIPPSAGDYPDPEHLMAETSYVYRYEMPATPTEQALIDIWNKVLERQRTGVTDDFLDLGGDSLVAVRLITHINDRIGTPIDLAEFFDAPSVRAVAAIIDSAQKAS